MGPPTTKGSTYGSVSAPSLISVNKLENGEAATERAKLLVENGDSNGSSFSKGKKNILPLLLKWSLIAVVVACTMGVATMAFDHYHTFREPHESHIDPNHRQGPLSLLDPVTDLGMNAFDRPAASQPTVHRSSRQTTAAPDNAKGGAAWPTNAWYQSFLLLDHNEQPTSLHRAYSLPYILDAAGPVAGMRVYPHHVGATSNVIQTYVIEQQGLTMGVATADGVSAPHRYHVEAMTPLGITLSWVSV